MAVAEAEGAVRVGDALVAVNGADVAHAPFLEIIELLQTCSWPLELRFDGEEEDGDDGSVGGSTTRARARSKGWARTVGAVRFGVRAVTSSRSAVSGGASRLRKTASSGGSAVGSAVSRGAGKALRGFKGGLRNVNFAPSSSSARNTSAEERERLQFLLKLVSTARLVPCGDVLGAIEAPRPHRAAPYGDEQPRLHTDVVCVIFGELTHSAAEAEFDAQFGVEAGAGGLRERLRLTWFRGTDDGKCVEIAGVTGGLYQPSVNDIGATVCLQCTLADDPSVQNFLEYGPVLAETSIVERAEQMKARKAKARKQRAL